MARFCPNCGQPVTENEKFCHQCGSTLQPTVDSQPADRLRANTPVPNADNISIVDINISLLGANGGLYNEPAH